jgi:hypothetical protein
MDRDYLSLFLAVVLAILIPYLIHEKRAKQSSAYTRPDPTTLPPTGRPKAGGGGDLWFVGQYRAETQSGIVWDLQGVFGGKERAIAACRNEHYFIAPIAPNVELPDETVEIPGCYYPLPETRNG